MKSIHCLLKPSSDSHGSGYEHGFTLIEVVVAIVLLGLLSTMSLGLYLASTNATNAQQRRDIGIMVANETMESVVAWQVTSLLEGREQTAVQAQWTASAAASGVGVTHPEWDASATPSSVPAIPLSSDISRLGTIYHVETLIGSCVLPLTGGECTSSVAAGADLYRVVIVVSWTAGEACAVGGCRYQTATLVEPTNVNLEWKFHE